jgi:hypothetical protein
MALALGMGIGAQHGMVDRLGVMEGDHMKELQDCSSQYKADF